MKTMRFAVWIVSFITMVLGAGGVCGQTTSTGSGQAASTGSGQAYPNKPIRIVASSPGGGADFVARLIGQELSASLGQQVIVDNRGGSGGVIAGDIVSRAQPDGYTLIIYGSTLWLAPLLREKSSSYDVVRDFSPITLADNSPSILVAHPSLQVKSVKELIVLAKTKPGVLNYGASGTGAAGHLAAELFKSMAGVNIVRINYKGNAPALNDLIAGQVQIMFGIAATVTPYVKSGRLTALAVTSAQPSALFPGLPTIAASGLPGYESVSLHAVFAPAKTPASIINLLNQEIVRFLKKAEVKEKFLNIGVEAIGSSPQQLAAAVKSEVARMSKVIKDAGIREEN